MSKGPKPAVSAGMDAGANVSGGNMPLPRPEKDLRLRDNEGRPGFPDAICREVRSGRKARAARMNLRGNGKK